jgi:hypothetical protein
MTNIHNSCLSPLVLASSSSSVRSFVPFARTKALKTPIPWATRVALKAYGCSWNQSNGIFIMTGWPASYRKAEIENCQIGGSSITRSLSIAPNSWKAVPRFIFSGDGGLDNASATADSALDNESLILNLIWRDCLQQGGSIGILCYFFMILGIYGSLYTHLNAPQYRPFLVRNHPYTRALCALIFPCGWILHTTESQSCHRGMPGRNR